WHSRWAKWPCATVPPVGTSGCNAPDRWSDGAAGAADEPGKEGRLGLGGGRGGGCRLPGDWGGEYFPGRGWSSPPWWGEGGGDTLPGLFRSTVVLLPAALSGLLTRRPPCRIRYSIVPPKAPPMRPCRERASRHQAPLVVLPVRREAAPVSLPVPGLV